MSEDWFRYCFGGIRHQAISWTNVDQVPWNHIVSLGLCEFIIDIKYNGSHVKSSKLIQHTRG